MLLIGASRDVGECTLAPPTLDLSTLVFDGETEWMCISEC